MRFGVLQIDIILAGRLFFAFLIEVLLGVVGDRILKRLLLRLAHRIRRGTAAPSATASTTCALASREMLFDLDRTGSGRYEKRADKKRRRQNRESLPHHRLVSHCPLPPIP